MCSPKGKMTFFQLTSVPDPDPSPQKSHGSGTLQLTECFALKVLLERLVGKLNITVITTDRSSSIKAAMR
jgi:hypothetical protein